MLNALRPLLLLVAVAAAAAPVHAEEARQRRLEAAERIREVERDGGRVLQAERMQRGGREVYRYKVLTPDGRVRVMHDARDREPPRTDRRSLMLRDRARRPEPVEVRPEPQVEAGRGEPRRGDAEN
ncbi:hypothetical protein K3217_18595 [bacterium BD-1]|jgi:hypothetical protein|uniref:hypothetical protein n=1 Tax=Arenimonas sp. TaxID=1872635 RepID=UPI001E32FA49|nr:hypothetical protein [Ottowia caeni]